MADKAKVHPVVDDGSGETTGYMIMCPACKQGHLFNLKCGKNGLGGDKPCWTFDGNLDSPTFSPSMLCRSIRFTPKGYADYRKWLEGGCGPRTGEFDNEPLICHSFVHDGRIEFLPDCTHELRGQTVDLEEW